MTSPLLLTAQQALDPQMGSVDDQQVSSWGMIFQISINWFKMWAD